MSNTIKLIIDSYNSHIDKELCVYALASAFLSESADVDILTAYPEGGISLCWTRSNMNIIVYYYIMSGRRYGEIAINGLLQGKVPIDMAYKDLIKALNCVNIPLTPIVQRCYDVKCEAGVPSCVLTVCAAYSSALFEGMISPSAFYDAVLVDSLTDAITSVKIEREPSGNVVYLRVQANAGTLALAIYPTGINYYINGVKTDQNLSVQGALEKFALAGIKVLPYPVSSRVSEQNTSYFTAPSSVVGQPATVPPAPTTIPVRPQGKSYMIRITETYTRDVEIVAETTQELGMKALELTKGHPDTLGNSFNKAGVTIKRLS